MIPWPMTLPTAPKGRPPSTPYLTAHDGSAAIDFYKRAFGAEERFRMENDASAIEHATLLIGDAIVYLSDELGAMRSPRTLGGSPVTMHMYVPDCDTTWAQALAAGRHDRHPDGRPGLGRPLRLAP